MTAGQRHRQRETDGGNKENNHENVTNVQLHTFYMLTFLEPGA